MAIPARAKRMVTASPTRIPGARPTATMSQPPSGGAMMIGRRFRMDCTPKAVARRPDGRWSPITAKRAGRVKLLHAITRTVPATIQCQLGATR
jgi:hypothetical protein